MTDKPSDDLAFARAVIQSEVRALQGLVPRLGDGFQDAVELLLGCGGRVVVTGIGKAGLIGQKISATLASTGTPSYSMHPVDAIHGDLGRIVAGDVVLALSNSGETEVVQVLKAVKRMGAKVIAVTGNPKSTLARQANVVLDIGPIEEACPLGLAPSASTTAMLALGDALALAVMNRRKFDKERYALYHPGGELGRRLMKVAEVMRGLDRCAVVAGNMTVTEVLKKINSVPGRAGAACVTDEGGRLIGIFTDGDLRRCIAKETAFLNGPICNVMTRNPKSVRLDRLAHEASSMLKEGKIDDLPVVDSDGKLCGILDVQDLLEVGLMPLDSENG